ncbi:MAG: CDP-diacylglycerol--glycerol-3-phosphate 3-phosphatidyltransferase [Deltaproteobacteria bacterium]|nr:MAG: CDP-diacylglycerol--glycerol-3-phosphate 3-phosphatidyltransferase [Deltaproteobacteria bacterium]
MKNNKPKKNHSYRINVPNSLTLSRILCIPVVCIFLSSPGKLNSFLAALCVSFAFITDILDGFFARKYGAVTVLGKFLDPLADKILVSVTMIMLIPLNRIQVWIVIIIVAREIAVTGLRAIAASEKIVIQASPLGKYKTIFQSIALICLCLHYNFINIDFHVVGMTFLWGALILTVWSGIDYFMSFGKVLSQSVY